jgi:hypothetical protein
MNNFDMNELTEKYFIDYFGSRVRLGKIGTNRIYEPDDYVGMSKSCAMDIAEEQINQFILDTPYKFNEWYNRICKYSTLYTAIHIYLFDPYNDTTQMVKDWFREFYIMNTL